MFGDALALGFGFGWGLIFATVSYAVIVFSILMSITAIKERRNE